jgi:hypothetical protein
VNEEARFEKALWIGSIPVRITEIADYVEAMIPTLRRFAANNDDIDLPNELVPSFLINFLTDPVLRAMGERPSHLQVK